MAKKRLFIAIVPGEQQQAGLKDLLNRLQKGAQFTKAFPKWVEPEKMHLTLKFLGDVEEERMQKMDATLAPAIAAFPAFEWSLGGLGVFPHVRAPKVIWVGLRKGAPQMKALAQVVEDRLGPLGFLRERREMHPHLTLARIKALKGAKSLMDLVHSHRRIEAGEARVEHVVLFESTLTPEGPLYKPLKTWPLGGPDKSTGKGIAQGGP